MSPDFSGNDPSSHHVEPLNPQGAEVSTQNSTVPVTIESVVASKPAELMVQIAPNRREEKERKPSLITIYTASEANPEHPLVNGDSSTEDEEKGIVIICDGVNGNQNPELASDYAATLIAPDLAESDSKSTNAMREKMITAFQHANTFISNRNGLTVHDRATSDSLGQDWKQPDRRHMATTAVACQVYTAQDGRQHAMLANVGDSPGYLLREGVLQKLTLDDNLRISVLVPTWISEEQKRKADPSEDVRIVHTSEKTQELEARRQLQAMFDSASSAEKLDPLYRDYFKRGSTITQNLGHGYPVDVHTYDTILEPEDKILLCTDGISDPLTHSEILAIANAGDNATVVNRLIEAARKSEQSPARAKNDDATASLLVFHPVVENSAVQRLEPEVDQPVQQSFDLDSVVNVRRSASSGGSVEHDWRFKGIIDINDDLRIVCEGSPVDGDNRGSKRIRYSEFITENPQLLDSHLKSMYVHPNLTLHVDNDIQRMNSDLGTEVYTVQSIVLQSERILISAFRKNDPEQKVESIPLSQIQQSLQ